MNEFISETHGVSASKIINNSGWHRYRTRIEKVNEKYLAQGFEVINTLYVGIKVPPEVYCPENWLLEMAKKEGLNNWDEIISSIKLPATPLICYPVDTDYNPPLSPSAILRAAVILSMTNKFRYVPGSPNIYTFSRLNRYMRLFTIKTREFYGLD